ncbi:hypothetical protein AQI95_23875 [Streptomyces yokosukanensis]|uniref:DUF3500 domain-containing protein n=1 Tax=Streptomyces yokosukanensis TaxID=67386 RepID=A0A101P248_9ACTN|nr:DUF3500 domain-containing protein [Streptomyces yokosukanensis]KUN03530.1 hypothetical protein AQI95_23875 [Streptomyces yokosukanensis]
MAAGTQWTEGIVAASLPADQRDGLVELIRVYLDRLPPSQAKRTLALVREHFDETRFAWRGGHDDMCAVKNSNGTYTLKLDENYAYPTWNEICGRAAITTTQNTAAGGALGRFTTAVRLLDSDAY